jgi:hypothetical protein
MRRRRAASARRAARPPAASRVARPLGVNKFELAGRSGCASSTRPQRIIQLHPFIIEHRPHGAACKLYIPRPPQSLTRSKLVEARLRSRANHWREHSCTKAHCPAFLVSFEWLSAMLNSWQRPPPPFVWPPGGSVVWPTALVSSSTRTTAAPEVPLAPTAKAQREKPPAPSAAPADLKSYLLHHDLEESLARALNAVPGAVPRAPWDAIARALPADCPPRACDLPVEPPRCPELAHRLQHQWAVRKCR